MAQRFQITVLGGGFPSRTPASLQYRLANDPSGRNRPLPESTPI